MRFNTSHVVIYRYKITTAQRRGERFNTSHVVIYPTYLHPTETQFKVSIHLMLLFISTSITQHIYFNNVSIHLMLLFIIVLGRSDSEIICFNTSHVVIYRPRTPCCGNSSIVSIHLMLLFISWRGC